MCYYIIQCTEKHASQKDSLAMRDTGCSCSSRHKRVLFHNFCSGGRLVVSHTCSGCCTHREHTSNKTDASSIPGKSECNQVGLTEANTMTSNHMKYSRLANVNWRSAEQRGLQARRLLTSALSIITWQLKDPSDMFSLICLLNLWCILPQLFNL